MLPVCKTFLPLMGSSLDAALSAPALYNFPAFTGPGVFKCNVTEINMHSREKKEIIRRKDKNPTVRVYHRACVRVSNKILSK